MTIVTARDAADRLAPLFADRPGETLAVLYLDAGGGEIALDRHCVAEDAIALPIRAILHAALDRDAAGLVIAHDHPSGIAEPSQADTEATRRLAEAAAALGIVLHDHLIFAGRGCRSFRELGLL